jgi:AsmA protein
LAGAAQRIDGTATASAALRGRVGEALDRSVRGRLDMNISNGVVRQFPLLATINRTLKLTGGEGSDTQFERLSATLNIAAGQATTDDLLLEAGHVRVQAAGRVGADRSLDLRGSAIVSAERVADAVASVRELARLRNSRGEVEVPLTITGSLDAPSFGLDVGAAVKQGLEDELRRRLRRFIRPPEY